jgi:uncharacterized membrane protein HdeD (DUF308 family)
VLIALCIKFGTDAGRWASAAVVVCGVAVVCVGLFVYVALLAARTDCKQLWKASATTVQGPLGYTYTIHSLVSSYFKGNCPAIINCSKRAEYLLSDRRL